MRAMRDTVVWSAAMSHPFANDLADYAPILPLPQRLQAHPDFDGRGVTMAFLDSGFFPHPDFAKRVHTYADATGEVRNVASGPATAEMTELLVEALRAIDAPQEQFIRLGVS